MSPEVSVSAALQSIMPAPVDSRSSLTMPAVIVAIVEYPSCLSARARRALCAVPPSATGNSYREFVSGNCTGGRRAGHAALQLFRFRGQSLLFRFRGQSLGLGNPAIGAARKSNLFTDLVRGVVIEFGELPI